MFFFNEKQHDVDFLSKAPKYLQKISVAWETKEGLQAHFFTCSIISTKTYVYSWQFKLNYL